MSDPGGHDSPRIPLYFKGMSGKLLTLTLPTALAKEFETLHQDLLVELLQRGLQEVKIDRALDLYIHGGLSFGAAAERAGVSQSELSRRAYARGMEPSFSAMTLAEELG
jgi:predicted HTH domain antitoxin